MQFETIFSGSPALSGVRAIVDRVISKRLVLGGVAFALMGAGLFWQWSWLVAIGVAPLLISAAPCIAMCSLGLCMHRMCSNSASAVPSKTSETTAPQQEA